MLGRGKHGSYCTRFQANLFNRSRCQHCFRSMDAHSQAALKENRIMRKVISCGYLFVAPDNFDASSILPNSLPRRWQRRWFSLYDDGELSFALDQHPETVPQKTVDMTGCDKVKLHKSLGPHSNCVEISGPTNKSLYIKAESGDEILRWYSILSMYSNQADARKRRSCPAKATDSERDTDLHGSDKECGTVIEVKSRLKSGDQKIERSSPRRMSDPLSQAKVDVSRNDSFHGTPRSVKNRNKLSLRQTKEEDRRSSSDVSGRKDELLAALAAQKDLESQKEKAYQIPEVDVSRVHTLRKGWLMLRGRSDAEWEKHWVVLAGLSLKLYKDAWAEESGAGVVEMDLTDCETVYPISVARNYGVEIRCKHGRYVLSAMTPGIRDSWISAIQQNLHSPSPTSPTFFASPLDTGITWRIERKKRIAYVAPESHHRSSNDASSSEPEEGTIDDNARDNQSLSERSLDLDSGTIEPNSDEDTDFDEERSSGSSGARRRRSLSPTLRRSPVSRIKDRASRRQRSPAGTRRFGNDHTDLRNVGLASEETGQRRRHHPPRSWEESVGHLEQENQQLRYQLLETQVETLRDELERTRQRVSVAEAENAKLRESSEAGEGARMDLERLRRCLVDAEREVLDRQDEMEALKEELDSSATELTGVEKALETEKEKMERVDSAFRERIDALEGELASLNQRLRTKEAELNVKDAQLEETQQSLTELRDYQRSQELLVRESSERELTVVELEKEVTGRKEEVNRLTERLKEMECREHELASEDNMARKTLDSYLSVIRERDEMIEGLRSERDACKKHLGDSEKARTMVVFRILKEEAQLISHILPSLKTSEDEKMVGLFLGHLTESGNALSGTDKKQVLDDSVAEMQDTLSAAHFPAPGPEVSVRDAETWTEGGILRESSSNTSHASLTACDSFVASFPSVSEFDWNHTLSPMHEELASSLASYLCANAPPDLRPPSSFQDLANYSAETSSLEIALVAEVADILEHAGNDRLIQFALLMHDVRNIALTLKTISGALHSFAEHKNEESFDDLSLNAFPNLVGEIKLRALRTIKKVEECVKDVLPEAMRWTARELLKEFLCHSWSMGPSISSAGMMKMELGTLLSRFESLSRNSSGHRGDLTQGLNCIRELEADILLSVDKVLIELRDEGEELCGREALLDAATEYWKSLQSEKGVKGMSVGGLGESDTLELICAEIRTFSSSHAVSSSSMGPVAKTLALKAIVHSLSSTIEQKASAISLEPQPDDDAKEKVIPAMRTSPVLGSSMNFYQPLARRLVMESLSVVPLRLVALCLSSYYESSMHNKSPNAWDCGTCRQLRSELRRTKEDWDDLKRRVGTGEDQRNPTGSHPLNLDLALAEDTFASERRLLKKEIEKLKEKVVSSTHSDSDVQELEQEIVDMQSCHGDDLDALRSEMNSEIDSIRDELAKEVLRRKKLQKDMADMKNRSDQSLQLLDQSHLQMINNIHEENRLKTEEIRNEYEDQLNEEKEATRQAIDALQKAHRAELEKQAGKLKLGIPPSESSANGLPPDSMDKRQSQMLEQMSKELSELSAAFSAKCLENSQLEEELGELKSSMEKQKYRDRLKGPDGPDCSNVNGLAASSSVENLSSPTGQRERRMSQRNRRNVHNGEMEEADKEKVVPHHVLQEFRDSLGVPVSERRKYFESLAGNISK